MCRVVLVDSRGRGKVGSELLSDRQENGVPYTQPLAGGQALWLLDAGGHKPVRSFCQVGQGVTAARPAVDWAWIPLAIKCCG